MGMTAEAFLSRAYRVDDSIEYLTRKMKQADEMAASLGSPDFEEHYNPNRPQEARFVTLLEEADECRAQIAEALHEKLRIKKEIQKAILEVEDPDERLVLSYKYLEGLSFTDIGIRMHADRKTVSRWHDSALSHVRVPEDADG